MRFDRSFWVGVLIGAAGLYVYQRFVSVRVAGVVKGG